MSLNLRVSLLTGLTSLVLVLLLIGVPTSMFGSWGATGNAAAAVDVERTFTVGVVDMAVSTLNPNVYTTVAEEMLISPCYSTLLQYDEDGKVIGDLASSWSSSDDGLTWDFELVDTASFCDPADPLDTSHRVTAADVIFTYWAIQAEASSRLHGYLPDVISAMYSPYDDFSVRIELTRPYAPFIDSLVNVPILPEYVWASESLLRFDNLPPVGSGPFFYATDGLPSTGYAELRKNPMWFMTEVHGWSVRVDRWVLWNELDENTAYLDADQGVIDLALNVAPNVFADILPSSDSAVGYSQSGGFVYEFNLNQMTDELRAALGGQFLGGANNQLLLDPVVKKAMAMCVDKQTFVDEVLRGMGSPADSLVPPSNPWHYDYPDPIAFDLQAARQMLIDAGWRYTETGVDIDYAPGYLAPLCKVGGTDPLMFRFYAPNTLYEWQVGASLIRAWAEQIGVELQLEMLSISDMNNAWYAADYDVWLWDWVFDILGDPTTSILGVLTSSAIGTDSDVFWVDAEYDSLYEQSMTTTDPVARADIFDQMQALAYEDMGCQCVAYKDQLYAAYDNYWTNLDGLGSKYMMQPELSNLWLSLDMYPHDNNAPVIYSMTGELNGDVGCESIFYCAAIDDDQSTVLEYRWFWGDGTSTAWSTTGTASHVYSASGEYRVDVAVREASASMDCLDYFVTSEATTARIYDPANAAPVIESVSFSPIDPDMGTVLSFVAIATDADGDAIDYSWDFGDGASATGASAVHQYTVSGVYMVTLSVTDNVLGFEPRPVTYAFLIAVSNNFPPLLSVSDFGSVQTKTAYEFVVSVFDSDPRDTLSFAWDWGDGSVSYTDGPAASHAYSTQGTYVITVTVSDNTGLPGHIVSDSGTVTVYSGHAAHGGTK